MKTIFGLGIFLLAGYAAGAQSRVTANISGISSNKGVCRVCLFTDEASFRGAGDPFRCTVVPVADRKAQAVFENLPAGTYALSVFHDANNNNKMDKNFLGIPKEGYGASLNKLPFASAPTFQENKFSLGANTATVLRVRLRNL